MDSRLECPGCRGRMDRFEDGALTLEVCGGCGGMWFDRGELEHKNAELPRDLVRQAASAERACPRCRTHLGCWSDALIEIDRCDRCHGVYLDAGELELLLDIRRFRKDASPREQTFFCDLCHQRVPLAEQVVGENVTVCPRCAERHEIRHDPKGRRNAELERRAERVSFGSSVDDSCETPGHNHNPLFSIAAWFLDLF